MDIGTGAGSQIWRMVKADLIYNRVLFSILCAVFLAFALFNVIYGRLERFMLQIILFSVALLGIFAGSEEAKTKGIRRMMLVPVSIGRIVVYRQAILVGYISSLMFLVLLSSLLAGKGWPEPCFLLRVIVMTGLLFILTSAMDIFFNLKFLASGSEAFFIARGFALAVAIAAVAVYVFFMNIIGKKPCWLSRTLTAVFVNQPVALLLFFAGVGLVVLTAVVFKARTRYTE